MCKNIIGLLISIQLLMSCILARRNLGGFDRNGFAIIDLNFTCPENHQPPEVIIDSVGDWEGNGQNQKYQDLILACTASYPVYWDYIPSTSTYYNMLSKVSINPVDTNSVNYCYKEQLQLSPFQQYSGDSMSYGRTGNYTCRSSVDSTISTSIFVYSRDNDRIFSCPSFSTTHSSIVNGSEWVIPCPANLKHEVLNVTLFGPFDAAEVLVDLLTVSFNKSDPEFNVLYPDGDPSIRYDSRYGFLLKTSNHSRPLGKYSCEVTTINQDHEMVDIEFKDYNVIPNKEYVTYINGSQIIVTCESDEDITINIDHSYHLTLKRSSQTKTSSFNFSITYYLEETIDPAATLGSKEGEITCRIKNTNKILHTWKHDVSKMCTAFAVNTPFTVNHYDPYSYPQSYIQMNNPFNKKMKIMYGSCGTKSKCELDLRYFDTLDYHGRLAVYSETHRPINIQIPGSNIISCEIDTNYTTLFVSVKSINEISLNPNNVTFNEKINITKFYTQDTDEIYVGDSIPFFCKMSQYFYSLGTIWKFLYKNGTQSIIKPDSTTELDDYNYIPSARTAIVLKIKDANITGIACSGLVWNTTIWESAIFKLAIEDKQIWDENATVRCDGGYHKPTVVLTRHPPYYINQFRDRYGHYRESNIKLASHIVTDTDFVVTRRNLEFKLICIAKYPVKWLYQGMDNLYPYRGPERNPTSGKGTIINDTLHHCFQTAISGSTYHSSQTGEYRCVKANDPKVGSYLYLFANLSPASPLVDEGEHKVVYIDPKASQMYIPCKVTDPYAKLDLYYHEDHGIYKKLNSSYFIQYDPKNGFLMETTSVNLSSIYICTSQNKTNSTDAVSFTFFLNTTEVTNSPEAVVSTSTSSESDRNLLTVNFVFLFLLIISVIGLQLWFLRKQFKIDGAMKRIFGTYINLEPETIATSNNEFQSNYHLNGNTQLIPSLF